VRCDQIGRLRGFYSHQNYPEHLRRIHFFDAEQQRHLFFFTNHFDLPTLTIAQLYKCRWQVELFFKWIKQHLRILCFYGTSPNAVKTQIRIAICVYVLVATIRKELCLSQSLLELFK
jgi:IS4 transposase